MDETQQLIDYSERVRIRVRDFNPVLARNLYNQMFEERDYDSMTRFVGEWCKEQNFRDGNLVGWISYFGERRTKRDLDFQIFIKNEVGNP